MFNCCFIRLNSYLFLNTENANNSHPIEIDRLRHPSSATCHHAFCICSLQLHSAIPKQLELSQLGRLVSRFGPFVIHAPSKTRCWALVMSSSLSVRPSLPSALCICRSFFAVHCSSRYSWLFPRSVRFAAFNSISRFRCFRHIVRTIEKSMTVRTVRGYKGTKDSKILSQSDKDTWRYFEHVLQGDSARSKIRRIYGQNKTADGRHTHIRRTDRQSMSFLWAVCVCVSERVRKLVKMSREEQDERN